MKARTVATTAAIVAAFAAVAWNRAALQGRIDALEVRLATVTAGMDPIHTRCEVLESLLTTAEQDLASVREASTALSGAVANQAALLAENGERVQQMEERLVEAREDADRRASELRATLDERVLEAGAAGEEVAELALQVARLEEQLELLPEGTIVPWLPGRGGLPPGWLLCNGARGTPDLRGLFLRGVGRLDEAGLYSEGAKMRPADLDRATPQGPGDWLVPFDAGFGGTEPEMLTTHGAHVHEDAHVPAHFTVVFIMKAPR